MDKYLIKIMTIGLLVTMWSCVSEGNKTNVEDRGDTLVNPELVEESVSAYVLEEVTEENPYGNKVHFTRRSSNFAKEGLYTLYTKKGGVMEEAYYSNDTLHGPRVMYNSAGDTVVVENYSMGLFEGEYRSYYENKQLEIIGEYVNNEMTGEWKRYYKNGQLMEVVTFEKNAENGPFVEYYETGKLKAEGSYKGGDNEDGELKLYDKNGELEKVMMCKMGVCRTQNKQKEDTE